HGVPHAPPDTPATQAPRPRPDRQPDPPVQPPDRGRLPRLVPPVHPVPPQAAPAGDGRAGSERIPEPPGRRSRRGRLHPEPGPRRAAVPLRRGAGAPARPALHRSRDPAEAAAGRPGPPRGAADPRRTARRAEAGLHPPVLYGSGLRLFEALAL